MKTCPCNKQRFFSPEIFFLKIPPEKKNDNLYIFAQNIDCGYMLEPPRRGGSNEYPQSMFWTKKCIPLHTPVLLVYKEGLKRVFIARTCFRDVRPRHT